jgi:O-antigen/teichoic acid export membrane protein
LAYSCCVRPARDTESERGEPFSLVANSTAVLVSHAISLLTGGLLAVYAIRTFSVEDYGRYAIALALTTLVSMLSEMGISTLAVREMSYRPDLERQVFGVALAAEFVTSAAAVVLLVPVAIVLGYSAAIIGLTAIGCLIVIFQGVQAALGTPFQARRVLVYVAGLGALNGTVAAAAGFPLIMAGAGPAGLMVALALGYASACAGAWIVLRRRLHLTPSWRRVWARVGPFLLAALPIAATGGIAIAYERIDLLLVSKLDSTEGAAVYAVALQALTYSVLLPAAVTTSFFPLLTKNLREDPDQGRRSVVLLARIFTFLSVPLVILFVVSGEPLVTAVLGDDYSDAAVPLAIISGCMVLGFHNYLFWNALVAAYLERRKLLILAVALPFNVALNLILIPPLGPTGAAIALLASDAVMGAWQIGVVRRNLFAVPLGAIFLAPLLVGLLSVAVGLAVATLSEPAGAVVGIGVFVVVLQRIGYVTADEWRPLTDALLGATARLRGLASRG